MCPEWRHDFITFLRDMGERPSKQHSIERKDNNGNYEPGNCVWATMKEQSRNKRSNTIIEFMGRDMCIAEAAEMAGIPRHIVMSRLGHGWEIIEALQTPYEGKWRKAS